VHKIGAIQKFVRNNYKLLKETSQFDKKRYKEIKKEYFGKVLKHQFGNPRDKEICDCFVELLIKTEGILDEKSLKQAISGTPFLKMNNITADQYIATISLLSKKYAIKEDIADLKEIDRIERQLEWVKKERTKEIEDFIIQKKEEYRRLPSILDDVDFEEPEKPPQRDQITTWWEDLNLKDNPFPGGLDGFSMIDKSLYQQIIVETGPILWALNKLEKDPSDIFHKGFLLAGEFGTGKTTFCDFISPHLTMKHIEPIRIALTANIDEAHYIQSFEKELCIEITKLARRFNVATTGPLIDISEARIHMLDIQKIVKGFVMFIDDLHKHANSNLVFRFLSHLQIVKNNFSRDGIDMAFIVAGFPSWRERIKRDSALTGFFDAPEELTLPEVTPALAAQAIKRRLQAFAVNPAKELEVKEEFLKSIFKRVCVERGVDNIGFRPYIQEAINRFGQRQFDILSVDITVFDTIKLQEIKATLEGNSDFVRSINKLIYGGGIKKKSVTEMTLKILCAIYLRKGVTEDEDFFNTQKFYFKRLTEAGLTQKFDRPIENHHILVWKVNPSIDELNKEIITKFGLSMEDYLVPIYSTAVQKAPKKKELTIAQVYEQDLKQWGKEMDPQIVSSLRKALTSYSVNIFQFTHSGTNSRGSLPSVEEVKESIWTMMKSIIRYESPFLLDICGETNIEGWSLRHRSLQCSEHFISLLRNTKSADFTVADHTRLISFADEAFGELWDDLKDSINVYRKSSATCYMLPKKILRTIYAEHHTLLSSIGQHPEYFSSLDRFLEQIEQTLRQYLLVSSTLVFGPYHVRVKYYPEDIRKYITKRLPSLSTSYEGYNEFENLNRGQYRSLFQDSGKQTPFYRYIIRPVIRKWDTQDINAFFEIFGDMNIITSHKKSSLVEDTKRDISTFFRLACRFIADICIRLKSLLMMENLIAISGDSTCILFGQRPEGYESFAREVRVGETKLAEFIYHHDITNALQSNALLELMNNTDNIFGCVELEMLEVDETRIKFGKGFSEIMSLIAYYLAKNKLLGKPLYGASIWLRETS